MQNTAPKVVHVRPSFPAQSCKPHTYSASHLYLRGSMYYFRYAFNEEYREKFQRSELRITLRTPYLRTAKQLSRKLRVYLEDLLMDDTHETYAEFRAELVQNLQLIIESGEKKKPVSIATIRQRLDKVRQDILDNADNNFYQSPPGVLFDSGKPVPISPAKNLEHQYQVFLKNMVNRPQNLTLENYAEVVLELLHKKIFTPEELTKDTIKLIINEFLKVQISLNRIMSSREKGDYAYERTFLSNTETSILDSNEHLRKIEERLDEIAETKQAELANIAEPAKTKKSAFKISELIDKYVNTKVQDNHWQPHSVPDYKNRLNFLLEILGDKNVDDITRDEIRYFRDVLCKLPPRRKTSKTYRGKTIDEILKMKPDKVLNIATVNIVVEAVSTMFKWAMHEEYLDRNPAVGLQLKDNRQEITLKEAFTKEDLKKIFNAEYTDQAFKNPAYYWAPLIALYTGMRLEEICQLHCADIAHEDGIWYFDVNENLSADGTADKKLKTKNAVRIVPVHERLIELGFLDFVKSVEGKHERIFHLLNKTTSKKRYGRQVSQHFSRYLKKIEITGNRSFHSFRHTFSDYFKKRNMHTDVFRQVFGHEISELAGRQYGSKFSVEQCYHELIALIDYDQL